MHSVYRAHDVFRFPWEFPEAFGLGLLEAMSSGLACIASPRGGIPEVGGEAVAYADPQDPSQWAARIRELLEDRALLGPRGVAARNRALAFTPGAQFRHLRRVLLLPEA